MIAIEGQKNETREFAIVLGQSEGSKGVMFVLYSFPRPNFRTKTNLPVYLGTLADDLPNAIEAAKRLAPGWEILVWENEAAQERRKYQYGYLSFGKFKDQHIEDVLDTDPKYFWWMINNCRFKGELKDLVESYRDAAKSIVIKMNGDNAQPALEVGTVVEFKKLTVSSKEDQGAFVRGAKPTLKYTMKDGEGNRFVLNTTVAETDINKLIVTGNFSTKMGHVFNIVKRTK